MPRKNRRQPEDDRARELDLDRVRRGWPRVQSAADGQWLVGHISAEAAVKMYRCPGCEHEIAPGIAHVVAWPADERGSVADRRHWHRGCWNARARRRPG